MFIPYETPSRHYKILELISSSPTLSSERLTLRPKDSKDLSNDYRWRMDPQLCQLDGVLRTEISADEFEEYHRDEVTKPSPWALKLAVDTKQDVHIGNVTIYNLDLAQYSAEFGIMIGDSAYWNRGYGREAGKLLIHRVLDTTEVQTIFLHTLSDNERAKACFAAIGFKPSGTVRRNGLQFQKMLIAKEQ